MPKKKSSIMNWNISSIITLVFFPLFTYAQQNYSGNTVLDCKSSNNTNLPDSFLYTCNGKYSTCKAFLIFTSKFPYNTVQSIAALMSSDQVEIAQLNNVTLFTIFPTEQEVIVPVNCSCSGRFYWSMANYEKTETGKTYFTVANDIYQGLSTCNALQYSNNYSAVNGRHVNKLRVPLRCSCPTSGQVQTGAKYLMTYSIGSGDTLYNVGERFDVSLRSIKEANGFTNEYASIYPFTTILIPLPRQPISTQTITRGYNPVTSPTIPSFFPIAPRKERSKKILFITTIATITFSLLITILVALILLFHRNRTRSRRNEEKSLNITSQEDQLFVEIARMDRALKNFKFAEIRKATRNFRSRNRINGFVYRGSFSKEVLTVKKIKGSAQNEVRMLYQLNHINIVKIHGYCEHEDDSYLVYEYMKNGSLQEWLAHRGSKDWRKLIQIALDVANGLLYLHYYTKPGYVHNNIRSRNILLDSNLQAKISNFSLAKTANDETSKVTVMNDVFAFGVILLELITAKYAQDRTVELASIIMGGNNVQAELRTLMEPGLAENGGMEYGMQVVKLSSSCLMQNPADQPNMIEIVSVLLRMQYHLRKAVVINIL